jgi:hypothetical protein
MYPAGPPGLDRSEPRGQTCLHFRQVTVAGSSSGDWVRTCGPGSPHAGHVPRYISSALTAASSWGKTEIDQSPRARSSKANKMRKTGESLTDVRVRTGTMQDKCLRRRRETPTGCRKYRAVGRRRPPIQKPLRCLALRRRHPLETMNVFLATDLQDAVAVYRTNDASCPRPGRRRFRGHHRTGRVGKQGPSLYVQLSRCSRARKRARPSG